MRNKFILIILSLVLVSCKNDRFTKRLPDEFMVQSHPPLQYPKNYILVTPGEIKSVKELPTAPDATERAFLEHFNDDIITTDVK